MKTVKEGDKVTSWFSDTPDMKSTVLKVLPYTGKYQGMFDAVLRLTAPRTKRGWFDMPVKIEEIVRENKL